MATGTQTKVRSGIRSEENPITRKAELSMAAAIVVMGAAVRLNWKGLPPRLITSLVYEGASYNATTDFINRAVHLEVRRGDSVECYDFPEADLDSWRVG